MSPRKKLAPRKLPIQPRSQATVDAILQAAAYILVKDGWAGLSTNRVADRAGVNIASLYQYFPNKEAIVFELQRRHSEKVRETLSAQFDRASGVGDLRALLLRVVEATVAEHRIAPALHRVLTEELPRSTRGPRRAEEDLERKWRALAEPLVRGVPDVDLALFLARVIVHAAVHEAAITRPELLERGTFTEEVASLVHRYLSRPEERRIKRKPGK